MHMSERVHVKRQLASWTWAGLVIQYDETPWPILGHMDGLTCVPAPTVFGGGHCWSLGGRAPATCTKAANMPALVHGRVPILARVCQPQYTQMPSLLHVASRATQIEHTESITRVQPDCTTKPPPQ